MLRARAFVLAGLLLLFATIAYAAGIPETVAYQGSLSNNGGNPVPDGNYTVTFALYTVSSGGTAVWTETTVITTSNGLFTHYLGSISSLPGNFFSSSADRWLGIKVGSDPELSPRTKIASVPYAYHSQRSDTADYVLNGGSGLWTKFDATSLIPADTGDNVGLGIEQPQARLHIEGASNNMYLRAGERLYVYGPALSFVGVNRDFRVTNSEVFGVHSTFGGTAYGGMYVSTDSPTGRPFYGYSHNTDVEAYHYWDGSTDKWLLNVGAGDFVAVTQTQRFGIGTIDPTYRFHVVGDNDSRYAGYFETNNNTDPNAAAVYGIFTGTTTAGPVYGVRGEAVDGTSSYGGFMEGGQYGGYGYVNNATNAAPVAYGIFGFGTGGSGTNYGVYGVAGGTGTKIGVYGGTSGSFGTEYAGYFAGDVTVTGSLAKGGGSFKIDHPLAPEDKYLQHSFVESPDMMNVYNGNVVLDASGSAVVQLPDYFEVLNRDFRYQLTAIGAPGPNLYIAEEISDNRFRIAGGEPGMKVSWQVTGVRQDAWAQKNRIQVEVDKPADERGRYLHPEAYGKDRSAGIEMVQEPETDSPSQQ